MSEISVLSLGWGVQSWALTAMATIGKIAKPDFAIHSDTTWERSGTYSFSERWGPWIVDSGINYLIASSPEYAKRVVMPDKGLYIPGYTIADGGEYRVVVLPDGEEIEFDLLDDEMQSGEAPLPENWKLETRVKAQGKKGQLLRSCTDKWKIAPLRRLIAAELKIRGLKKTPDIAEIWLGISLDEFMRAKHSPIKYIHHEYPLLDLKLTREDCELFLMREFALKVRALVISQFDNSVVAKYIDALIGGKVKHDYLNLVVPGKSSCTFCPYHSAKVWMEMAADARGSACKKRVDMIIADCPALKKHEEGLTEIAAATIGNPKADWEQALMVDGAIRDKRPGFSTYLNSKRIPLSDVDKLVDDGSNPEDEATCDSGFCFM